MSALSKGHLFLFRATTCHCLDRDRYQHCKQRKHAFGMVWLGFFCYEMLWIDLVCLVLVLFGLVWYDKIKFRATTCHCFNRDWYQHYKQRKHAFGMVWLGFFCYEMLWIDLVCLVLVLFGLVWYDKIKFRATTCHCFNRDWYQHCKQRKHGLTCFWLGLFWYEILWIDFMSDKSSVIICEEQGKFIVSACY